MSQTLVASVNTANLGFYITSLAAMIALAGLDFAGALLAKEWTIRRDFTLFLAGGVVFLLLYVVYAHILQTAELSIVTFGWVAFLQVALVLVDRFRYGVSFDTTQWLAMGAMILLQAYLIVGPRGS
ncbi:MAG: hypothetical protein AB7V46_12325 [Thermomicrobiales bacterium]